MIEWKKIIRLSQLVCVLILASGCMSTLESGGWVTPRATVSEYFETRAAGFIMEAKEGRIDANYSLTLKVVARLPVGSYLEIEFDNPKDKSRPLQMSYHPEPGETEIRFESPQVYGIKAYQSYQVVIRIYDDPTKTSLLGTHHQWIRSILDQTS